MESTWFAGPWLGFDTETTGVDAYKARVVTAAAVRREHVVLDAAGAAGAASGDCVADQVQTWMVDPGVEIPPAAAAVHGISTEQARAEGMDARVGLDQIAAEVGTAMADGVPIVAFNASFDLTLLECELERHGLPSVRERAGGEYGMVLDPLVLDRKLDRWRRGKRKLIDMLAVYGVDANHEDLHAADVDVIATLDVLAAMVRKFPALRALAPSEVNDFQARAHAEWAESFERFLRLKGRDATISRSWPIATPES